MFILGVIVDTGTARQIEDNGAVWGVTPRPLKPPPYASSNLFCVSDVILAHGDGLNFSLKYPLSATTKSHP